MSYITKFLNLFRKTREQKIIEKCGCICYCDRCREPLNDISHVLEFDDDIVTYICSNCSKEVKFYVGAPTSIVIEY